MKKTIYFALIMILFAGCVNFVRDDPYGRYMPKSPHWRIKTSNPDPEHLLKYDKIYMAMGYDFGARCYIVMRFWPSGQCVTKIIEEPDDMEVALTFDNSTIGYFVVREGMVYAEWFVPINFGQYMYSVMAVENDGILREISQGETLGHQKKYSEKAILRFRPIDVEISELIPDW